MKNNRAVFRISYTIFAVLLLVAVSCAGSAGNDPMIPSPTTAEMPSGHNLAGMFDVHIDLTDGTCEVTPVRTGASHYNVTAWLMPPFCSDCFKIHVVTIDPLGVIANVTVKNFTKALTGYDVRGIVYPLGDYILMMPDAYTFLYAPSGVTEPAGFRAFDTEDPERAMEPGESSTVQYVISYPPGAGFINLRYAVDASWPGHCPEAYDIYDYSQIPLDKTAGATAEVSVMVDDWQDDTIKVTIETDALAGSEIDLTQTSPGQWTGTITNEVGMPPGKYPALITARDTVTLNHLYQHVEIVVTDLSDFEPPVWDSDVGIKWVFPGMTGYLIYFGTASDTNGPVKYNLYCSDTEPIDFDSANKISEIENSPYLLMGLDPGQHFLCVRAVDALGYETDNTDATGSECGIHPNVWWQNGPDMTVPRGNSGGIFENGNFWVLGGSTTGIMVNTVERYNTTSVTWDKPWSLPESRDAFGCGVLDGNVYIFGGRFAETEVTDTCQIINLSDGTVDATSPTYPLPLCNMGCALLDGTFYIAGGRDFSGTAWVYHRATYSYTPPGPDFIGETDMEYDTCMMGFAAGDSYLISCGGQPDREDVLYHTPGTKSWNFRAPLQPGRDGNASVLIDGWLYSMGGNYDTYTLENTDVLDVEGDVWYPINPMNHARSAAVAATDGEYIYVAGGFAVGQIPLASLEVGTVY